MNSQLLNMKSQRIKGRHKPDPRYLVTLKLEIWEADYPPVRRMIEFPFADVKEYYYSFMHGNKSCDCNRAILFLDDASVEHPCSEDKFCVRLTDHQGKVLIDDSVPGMESNP